VKFYSRPRRTPQVIIVSLIDIFAILLIFVIVTSTFKKVQPQVTIKLPESKGGVAAEKSDEPVVLSISSGEELFLDSKKLALPDLAPAIESLRRDRAKFAMAMKADEKVSYGFLIKVLDALKDAGVKGNLSAFTEQTK
jgi:biopolymer transport protein ExbD